MSYHKDNIVVGAGELYLELLDENGTGSGERYLGDALSASLTVSSDRVTVFSGSGAKARILVNTPRSIERSLTMTLHDVSLANLALYFGATASQENTDQTTAVNDETYVVKKGLWYQIGKNATSPKSTGVGAVDPSSVAVTSDANGQNEAYIEGTDYLLDAKNGRFFIVPSGAINDEGTIKVDYTPSGTERHQVKTGDLKDIRASIRYIERPVAGRGRNYYAPLCSLSTSGDLDLMSRDSEQQFQLTAHILEPTGKAALYIDGENA